MEGLVSVVDFYSVLVGIPGYGLVLAVPIGQSVRSVALQVLQSDPVTLYIVYHGCRVTEAV